MRSLVLEYLDEVYRELSGDTSGSVADYIPELAIVDPESFAICLCTNDGYLYEAGDSSRRFAIQSISKPFTYALALADRGLETVAAKVDVEPSGEPFNEISLDAITERPRNPMINAGAITCASLVQGDSVQDRFERLRQFYSRCAGRDLRLDEEMFASEDRTGHRNRAIGYMLRSFGILEEDPQTTLGVYFRQCSIEVDCRDLSRMAATLANSGVCPITGDRVLEPAITERVLSVMTTCGMYNAAGDWVTEVGLPAKSGVGGGIIAVLPGQTRAGRLLAATRRARQQRARRAGLPARCHVTSNCTSCTSAGRPGRRCGRPMTSSNRLPGAGAVRRSRRCCSGTAAGHGCTSCTATCCSPRPNR